jgi:hypothetical protein
MTSGAPEIAHWKQTTIHNALMAALDHPKYSAPMAAGWLGCGKTRISDLRVWGKSGFAPEAHKQKLMQLFGA